MSDEPFRLSRKPKILFQYHRQFNRLFQALTAAEAADVDDVIDSLNNIPDQTGDRLLEDTEAGDLWVRRKNNSYVMYTYTRNDPESKYLVKCWVCGKYVMRDGEEIFDIA
ncbi:hypothetical protein HUE56_16800 [Azospirillum oryzae]|uniref:Uncharacterized protein n=1 Tax=Azospirillum oryzae TaxID=286727 RepID=A0A6N1AK56_9PROT|nr:MULTISPECIES: hypothetical protein [Azospirillum]KAA0576779.1 hypothetical protein FZ029_13055 [Azospirillum sp. Sh1]KAA0590795.1 hypothetical protein FZ938_01390 [Azospirillum oryzae]QKS52081.1 hypothetical protein HUE56_16800 [Azospirillum oryzae]GLR77876.1 hypothetical protein GCM10007856_05450 [Azospirillum oryzae]